MDPQEQSQKNAEEIATLKAQVADQTRRLAEFDSWTDMIEARLHEHGKKLTVALLFKDEHIAWEKEQFAGLRKDLDALGTAIRDMSNELEAISREGLRNKWVLGLIVTGALAIIKVAWDSFTRYVTGGFQR